jgi:hypothetical protein
MAVFVSFLSLYDLLQPLRSLASGWRALAAPHDAAVQMIDTSIVRVDQLPLASPATGDSPWAGREAV